MMCIGDDGQLEPLDLSAKKLQEMFAPVWEPVLNSEGHEVAIRPRVAPFYEIAISTIRTFADVVHWMSHLSPKNWVTGEVLFWFYYEAVSRLSESERPKGWDQLSR